MSIAAVRAAVKVALDSVDGVTGYLYAPNIYKDGDGWCQWGGFLPPETGPYATSFTDTFRVIVIMPADQKTADLFLDAIIGPLIAALSPVMSITRGDYVKLPQSGSQAAYSALAIIGETE